MVTVNNKSKSKTEEGKDKNRNTFDTLTLDASIEERQEKRLIILTPKQMSQRLPTALAQVNSGNTSEKLLNEIRKIIYSLNGAKEITKKVYNNVTNSVKV